MFIIQLIYVSVPFRWALYVKRLEDKPPENEKWLQDYIAEHPEVIDIGEDICILSREFQTNSGPVDLVGVGRSGVLYIIEVKLERNATRREVIAQAIDYGSAIWRRTTGFIKNMEKACLTTFGMTAEEKLSRCFGLSSAMSKEMLKKVAKNTRRGNIIFVIAMDNLTPRI